MWTQRGSSTRAPRFPALGLLVSLSISSATGCSQCEGEAPAASPSALTRDTPAAPAAAPEPSVTPPAAAAAPTAAPTDGWSELVLRDTLPLCVFSSYAAREKALRIEQVKKQMLKANAPVIFGVFGPWCLNAACDERPTLQCWTERKGSDLIVHTLYSSLHKEGSSCTTDCRELDVSCETPTLEPGTYTVRHGDKAHPLEIPSVQRAPCLFESK